MDVFEAMKRRRTVRRFTAEPVRDDQIDTMLEMAMYAPSRLDRQPWHFVVIRDKELQKELGDLMRIKPYLEDAPVVVAVYGLQDASPTWKMDVSAAIQNILLAATGLGLGATWASAPDNVNWETGEDLLCQRLGVPREDVRIAAFVAIGHPGREPEPHDKPLRFDSQKVHYGRWGALREMQDQDRPIGSA